MDDWAPMEAENVALSWLWIWGSDVLGSLQDRHLEKKRTFSECGHLKGLSDKRVSKMTRLAFLWSHQASSAVQVSPHHPRNLTCFQWATEDPSHRAWTARLPSDRWGGGEPFGDNFSTLESYLRQAATRFNNSGVQGADVDVNKEPCSSTLRFQKTSKVKQNFF